MSTKAFVPTRRIRDIMSKEVVYIDCGDTVHEALNLMVENRVSALPVVNGKLQCVGMISTSDLVGIARDVNEDLLDLDELTSLRGAWLVDKLRQEFGDTSLVDLMSLDVETVGPETTINEAAREMLRYQVHRLPVVDQKKRLLGIVSTMDLLQVLAEGA